jgi:hypothetical protein
VESMGGKIGKIEEATTDFEVLRGPRIKSIKT